MATHKRKKLAPTPWHTLFAQLLDELGSPDFDVITELEVLVRPARADIVLLRRHEHTRSRRKARVLLRIWGWVLALAVVELKTATRPLRAGDLGWFVGLLHLLDTRQRVKQPEQAMLQGLLVVASLSPLLDDECARLRLTRHELGGGYHELRGASFDVRVVALEEVADAEKQPLLDIFTSREMLDGEARRWMSEHGQKVVEEMGSKQAQANRDFLEKFLATLSPQQRMAGLLPEQVLGAFSPEVRVAGLAPEVRVAGLPPEERVAGLAPEERVAGLAPEQVLGAFAPEQVLGAFAPEERVAGLAPEQLGAALGDDVVLALPDEALRGLSPDYIATLPADVQARIKQRLSKKPARAATRKARPKPKR